MRFVTIFLAVAGAAAFVPASQQAVKTAQSSAVANLPLATSSALPAILERTELPEKLYVPKAKETPKILGGLKIGIRELVVVTGASSGLGLTTARTLAKSGNYFVVMACRNVEKAKQGTHQLHFRL